MKTILAISLLATSLNAAEVPLNITAIGNTKKLMPKSISYIPSQEAVADDLETIDIDETAEAVHANFVITADYRLGYKTPVVTTDVGGISVKIAPKSSPVFTVEMVVPVAMWSALNPDADVAQLASVLQTVGAIVPSKELTTTIRNVAFALLSEGENQ